MTASSSKPLAPLSVTALRTPTRSGTSSSAASFKSLSSWKSSRPTTPREPIDVRQYLIPPPCASPRRPKLPEEYGDQLKALQKHFNAEGYELEVKEESEERAPLSEREKMFLSRETFVRYLLATKGELPTTIQRLESTLVWRRTERIDDLEGLAEKYRIQNRTGKALLLGFTPDNLPIVYSFMNRNPVPAAERRGVDTTFMLERATDLMVDGVTESLFIFQYGGEKLGESSNLNTTRDMLQVISSHYPYKISLSTFQGMPWLVRTATNVVWPFVDHETKERVKFDIDMVGEGIVEKDVLLKQCGGKLEYEYDHELYWEALIDACLDRRREQLEHWRKLGAPRTGREERLFKLRPERPLD